jgi:hypothetical protein
MLVVPRRNIMLARVKALTEDRIYLAQSST